VKYLVYLSQFLELLSNLFFRRDRVSAAAMRLLGGRKARLGVLNRLIVRVVPESIVYETERRIRYNPPP
jgi:hypothetical protein